MVDSDIGRMVVRSDDKPIEGAEKLAGVCHGDLGRLVSLTTYPLFEYTIMWNRSAIPIFYYDEDFVAFFDPVNPVPIPKSCDKCNYPNEYDNPPNEGAVWWCSSCRITRDMW